MAALADRHIYPEDIPRTLKAIMNAFTWMNVQFERLRLP
jgi:hypothetical protein